MTTEKQIAALIAAKADPVLISKFRTLPASSPVVQKVVEAAVEIVEVGKKEKRRKKEK